MRRLLPLTLALMLSCSSESESMSTPSSDGDASSEDVAAGETSIGADSASEDGTSRADVLADAELYGPYPGGPYGNTVGDALPNLSWRGFVNETSDAVSNTKPFVSTTLDALRRMARRPYALIHVSEFY